MSKIDLHEEMKINTCLSKEKKFTEEDFVRVLFSYLTNNGVYQVLESDLKRKLYFYYENPEFQELFQDICKARGSLNPEVDISEGLYHEKYFGGNIVWGSNHSDKLNLVYPFDIDLSDYEKKLSKNGLELMRRLAFELALRDEIESRSTKELHIYGTNPNQVYSLIYGKYLRKDAGLELLSDGDVQYKKFLVQKTFGEAFFDSPFSFREKIQMENALMADVFLKNASYAIVRGIYDGQIQYANAYTNIVSEQELRKIRKIANTSFQKDEYLALKGEPFVRKLNLK